MIVLDTHVWVWWTANPEELSRRARDVVQQAKEEDTLYLRCFRSKAKKSRCQWLRC